MILHSLYSSSDVVEATKFWDVGALLSLFDEDSQAKIEALILQNISGSEVQAKAS